ncbi:MAG: sensor histidine kinase [Acidimicrobiia bacterium]
MIVAAGAAHGSVVAAAMAAVLTATFVAGLALRRALARTRSLRNQVLAITLTALVVGALAATVLARLMVLSPNQERTVLAILGVTAVFSVALVLSASHPLGRDVRHLEQTVRRIEAGDRSARAKLDRVDELGHVASALDALNANLDALEHERARFDEERTAMLANIGHDLRTPLTALRSALEALSDGVAPDPQRYLRSMQRDVEALTHLVEDFFLLARIDAGRLPLATGPVDLTEIADEAVEALTPLAASRDVTLRLVATTRVRASGDNAAIGRIIRNLVDNAIRHTRPGSTVDITVTAADRPLVRVTDEGDGFADEFAAHAFDHFSRADTSRTRSTGGGGLGLTIARGLVEACGGTIWIEPPPGGRVAFELPA